MSLVTDLQNVAADLISEFGQVVVMSRVVEGAYVPDTGAVGAGTTTSWGGYLVPEGLTRDVGNTKTGAGDTTQTTIIDAILYTATTPKVGDVATTDSTAYRVMSVVPVKLSGSTIIYNLQLQI